MIAIVLAATATRAFELDRFFVPKELVLHLTAALAGLLAVRKFARVTLSRIDLLLCGWLAVSAFSAAMATNPWLSFRSLAISVSSLLLFWSARCLREAGLAHPLLNALALGVVLVAATGLLQAYGLELTLFSQNRAPGGMLGNRNFVAHAAAFGLPILLLRSLGSRHARGSFLAALGVLVVTCCLVLTRSRAAWLAFAVLLLVFLLSIIASAPLRRSGRTWIRLGASLLLTCLGVAAAVLLPNTLRWRSDTPYVDTMRRVADYEEGSGRGRLIQYDRSLRMALAHPLLGVGPGNWAVAYPEHAAANDPSLDGSKPEMTLNPWPSSDWVAWTAERGFPAVALMGLVFAGIAVGGIRQLFRAHDAQEGLLAAALIGTIAGAAVTGAFDAVLLLALPALIVWTALGALWSPSVRAVSPPRTVARTILLLILAVAAMAGATRSAMQLAAMQIHETRSDREALERAARIDPGNDRILRRLMRMGGRSRCDHARAAHALYPTEVSAARVSRQCGE